MLGSQALIGYQNFDGSFKAYTSSITSYQTMLQEDNLSFPVYNLSGMFVNGSMMIFASLQLPQNVTLVNHAWQEGLVSNDGSLKSHALRGPNIQSFGTLDFTSGNIISQNVGAKLKSKMMLRIVSNILLFFSLFFIQIAILYLHFSLGDHPCFVSC
ncbi:putative DOMON domain-containing protein [Medicago truncatula]|uniref:Putative DOMON domain-containing protein n=1 Tax=Medicago truncatula TaxID=3880 RepID=A0A396H913_MEDTR|nr:putative DOMON domain-containing protein [Medicago truncatula]